MSNATTSPKFSLRDQNGALTRAAIISGVLTIVERSLGGPETSAVVSETYSTAEARGMRLVDATQTQRAAVLAAGYRLDEEVIDDNPEMSLLESLAAPYKVVRAE